MQETTSINPGINKPDKVFIFKGNLVLALPLIILLMLVYPLSTAHSGDNDSFTPWDFNKSSGQNKMASAPRNEDISGKNFFIGSVRFYQRNLSPVLGGRCPMDPSCSRYSIQAINKHGAFLGLIMTADRLLHEADETRYATAIVRENKVTFSDPVENNDFWFSKDKNR